MTELTDDLITDPDIDATAEQVRALLQAACDETWNRHDAAALAAHASPDAVMRVVPLAQTARGTEQIRQLAEERLKAFPDWHVEVRDAFMSGDRLCGQTIVAGTHEGEFLCHAPTGRRMEVEMCCVFRLGDAGLLAEEVVYFDLTSMLHQLGLPVELPDVHAAHAAIRA